MAGEIRIEAVYKPEVDIARCVSALLALACELQPDSLAELPETAEGVDDV